MRNRDTQSEQEEEEQLSHSEKLAQASELARVKKMLAELQESVKKGAAIADPEIDKKQELVSKLMPIMDTLIQHWDTIRDAEKKIASDEKRIETLPLSSNPEDSSFQRRKQHQQDLKTLEETKEKFKLSVEKLGIIIRSVQDLHVSTQATVMLQNEIHGFNNSTQDINKLMTSLLEQFGTLQQNTTNIARLDYGKKVSTYMIYVSAALKSGLTLYLAWIDTLSEATKTAGTIFYPISATFTTTVKLLAFLGTIVQYFIASSEANKELVEIRKEELENSKAILRKSTAFKFVAFTLNFLSILAFAGLLTTPVGWIFVAAATAIDWVNEGLHAYYEAQKSLKKFDDFYRVNTPEQKEFELSDRLKYEAKVNQTRTTAIWGFANTVAVILLACSPIPVAGPFIALAGIGLLSVVTIRNVYVAGMPYAKRFKNYFFPSKEKEKGELDYHFDNEIELQPMMRVDRAPSKTNRLDSSSMQNAELQATAPLEKQSVVENSNTATSLPSVETRQSSSFTPKKAPNKTSLQEVKHPEGLSQRTEHTSSQEAKHSAILSQGTENNESNTANRLETETQEVNHMKERKADHHKVGHTAPTAGKPEGLPHRNEEINTGVTSVSQEVKRPATSSQVAENNKLKTTGMLKTAMSQKDVKGEPTIEQEADHKETVHHKLRHKATAAGKQENKTLQSQPSVKQLEDSKASFFSTTKQVYQSMGRAIHKTPATLVQPEPGTEKKVVK